jgi:hypothetical protein
MSANKPNGNVAKRKKIDSGNSTNGGSSRRPVLAVSTAGSIPSTVPKDPSTRSVG